MKSPTQIAPPTTADKPARGRKPRKRLDENVPLPPTLDGATLLRVREPLRQDAIQEAWAAHLAGENPNDAVRSFVRRNARAERRFLCFSQLDPDEQERIYTELPE